MVDNMTWELEKKEKKWMPKSFVQRAEEACEHPRHEAELNLSQEQHEGKHYLATGKKQPPIKIGDTFFR